MIPGIKPTVDYAFKKVFGSENNKPVLIEVLQAVVKPPADERIVQVEIRNPFNDKDGLDNKLSILDIKARDQLGRQYNVEMQVVTPRIYPQRVLYYWAVLHSQQMHEGADYALLRPTISISFVNSVLFPKITEYHLHFQLRTQQHPELVFSAQQSIHVIELPKFKLGAEELTDPLDIWCYFLVHGATLDTDNLPAKLRTPAVQRAMEVLKMLTQNDVERERYLSRHIAELDQIALETEAREAREALAASRAEALAAGRAEGRAEGLQKGEVLGRIHLCQQMLQLPLTPLEELLALPLVELHNQAAALEQRLGIARS